MIIIVAFCFILSRLLMIVTAKKGHVAMYINPLVDGRSIFSWM